MFLTSLAILKKEKIISSTGKDIIKKIAINLAKLITLLYFKPKADRTAPPKKN